jgi:Tol biopolymer transport system component
MERGTRLGPYEIVGRLGAGGMGEVYRARDTRLGREVAVKVLAAEFTMDPDRLRRFELEARAVAALNHPNILALHDVGSHDGSPFLVTELLEGESLRDALSRGAMPVRKAVQLAVQLAQGLAAAHQKGIIHRDLKPENVFVGNDGHIKILDFGIAKLAPPRSAEELAKATTVVEATEAGRVPGTVAYMSPEQVRGLPVDQASDIFGFGCVLYEMMSGRKAFGRATVADTMSAILHEDPDDIEPTSGLLSGSLRQVLRRCLEKRPGDRFSSAHDLAFALEAVASDDSAGSAAGAPGHRQIARVWLAAAAASGALAVVAGVWIARSAREEGLPAFHTRQVTGQLGTLGKASISPGGDEIAYAAGEHGSSGLWITDVRGGKALRLAPTAVHATDPAWFPDGSALVFTAEEGTARSIWKVSRFGGAPILLVPDAKQGAPSPDGSRVAFARAGEDGFSRIWVAELGAVDQARRITGPGDGLFDHESPAWSPNSKTICYSDARDLWLVPAAGGRARPVMKDDAEDSQPAWSADGRHLYFMSAREGTIALWRIPAAGGRPVRVTDGTGSERFPSLSRDGRRLAFVSRHASGGIALADLRTDRVARLQEGSFASLPAIAPDRSALVFVSQIAGSSTLRSVALRDGAPAGESVVLADQAGDLVSPAFSPDGRWVAYYRAIEGRREVWVIPSTGGLPVNFSGHAGQDVQPAWSPDSRQIAFVSDRGGAYQIWAAPFADGRRAGEPRRLTSNQGAASYPTWSPDGKTIAYRVLAGDEMDDVWVVPADASGPSRRLTSGAQAGCLRWFGASGEILVSGLWGGRFLALRLLDPATGALRPFALPASVVLDPDLVDFDLSPDGSLMALFEGRGEGVIWVREAEQGSF